MQSVNNKTLFQSYKNLTTFIEGYGKKHQAQYLLPLRLFIALGWLRAGIEKLSDGDWRNGSKLLTFFDQQISGGHVPFPAYQGLMEGIFTQQVVVMSWLVALGQLLAGIAIFVGGFTTAALLGAIFLNINFMLAGRVNPSAFYIMMELVLLQSKAGQLWGLDTWLSHRTRLLPIYPTLIKLQFYSKKFLQSKRGFILQISTYGGLCLAFVPFIQSIHLQSCLSIFGLASQSSNPRQCLDLSKFVDDPAMFLSLICGFALLSTILRVLERSEADTTTITV